MYVYVISAGPRMHKIGISVEPKKRLGSLQTGHYRKLRLCRLIEAENAEQVEAYAHRLLKDRRSSGEWFSVTEDEAAWAVEYAGEAVSRGERPGPVAAWPSLSEEGLAVREPAIEDGWHLPTASHEAAAHRRALNDELYRRLVAPNRKPRQKAPKK